MERYENKPMGAPVCPHCEEPLDDDEIRSLWGQYTSALVKNHIAGPGRPRSDDRCKCGKFTRERAAQRNHVCITREILKPGIYLAAGRELYKVVHVHERQFTAQLIYPKPSRTSVYPFNYDSLRGFSIPSDALVRRAEKAYAGR